MSEILIIAWFLSNLEFRYTYLAGRLHPVMGLQKISIAMPLYHIYTAI